MLNDFDGMIIAGVGNGNVSDEAIKLLKQNKKVIIVKSSRTGSGIIISSTEIDDKKHGFITANNLTPQQARILLMVALSKTKNKKNIQDYFNTY